jgi:hypothetical protein
MRPRRKATSRTKAKLLACAKWSANSNCGPCCRGRHNNTLGDQVDVRDSAHIFMTVLIGRAALKRTPPTVMVGDQLGGLVASILQQQRHGAEQTNQDRSRTADTITSRLLLHQTRTCSHGNININCHAWLWSFQGSLKSRLGPCSRVYLRSTSYTGVKLLRLFYSVTTTRPAAANCDPVTTARKQTRLGAKPWWPWYYLVSPLDGLWTTRVRGSTVQCLPGCSCPESEAMLISSARPILS